MVSNSDLSVGEESEEEEEEEEEDEDDNDKDEEEEEEDESEKEEEIKLKKMEEQKAQSNKVQCMAVGCHCPSAARSGGDQRGCCVSCICTEWCGSAPGKGWLLAHSPELSALCRHFP